MQSTLGENDAILPEWFWIIDLDPDHPKGEHQISERALVNHTFIFVFMQEFGYYCIFYTEHVDMKEKEKEFYLKLWERTSQ